METEIWKPIPDYPEYEVSNLGNVRSYRMGGNGIRSIASNPHLLKQFTDHKHPRLHVNILKGNKHQVICTHRLVLMAFIGPCPPGQEGCHNDTNYLNNNLSNLRWDTRKNNRADEVHINKYVGDNCWNSQINSTIARAIREQYQQGIAVPILATRFSIGKDAIYDILHGKSWRTAGGPILAHWTTRSRYRVST